MKGRIKVLNLLSSVPKEINKIFIKTKVEVVTSVGESGGAACALVDSLEHEGLQGIQNIIYISNSISPKILGSKITSIISLDFASTEIGAIFIERAISARSSVHLEKAFDGVLKKNQSIKIVDPFSAGHYGDVITDFAFRHDYSLVAIRNFVSSLTSFFHYLFSDGFSDYPVDVSYGVTNDSLIIRFHSSVNGLFLEHIRDSLKKINHDNPYEGLLAICRDQCDALDICKVEKTQRLIISGVWTKDYKGPKNLLIFGVESFSFREEDTGRLVSSKIELIKESEDLINKKLDGGPQVYGSSLVDEIDNLSAVKRAMDFVISSREKENDKTELTPAKVAEYLEEFGDKEVIKELPQDNFKTLTEISKDENKIEEVRESVSAIKGTIDDKEYSQKICEGLEKMDWEEARKVIPGITEHISDQDDWNKKFPKMVEEIKKGVGNIRIDGTTENIKDELIKISGEKFNLGDDVTKKVFDLASDISTGEIVKKKMDVSWGDLKIHKQNMKLKNALEIRDQKMKRMKKAIDLLKEKVLEMGERSTKNLAQSKDLKAQISRIKGGQLREEMEKNIESQSDDASNDVAELKKRIGKAGGKIHSLENILKKREMELEKTKRELALLKNNANMEKEGGAGFQEGKLSENILHKDGRDLEIDLLKSENKNLKKESFDQRTKIENLADSGNKDDEVKQLQQQLKEADHKVALLNNLLNQKKYELEQVKKKFEAFKSSEVKKLSMGRHSREINPNGKNGQKEDSTYLKNKISIMKASMSSQSDRIREVEIAKKNLEQKFNSLSRENEMLKRKNKEVGDGVGGQLKEKVKIIEKMSANLDDAKKQLAEKKTDAHKVNLENKTLKNKIIRLEKQLGSLGENNKKAS